MSMGVYLPNVDMPKGRPVCIVIDAAGQARHYDLNNDRYADDKLFEAVPVPPHGRCIDADALISRCKDEKGSYYGHESAIIGEAVESAPTVIEAED